MRKATTGGVIALPRRAKEWVRPCAKPRLPRSTQFCMASVAVGKVAPSPKPSSTLTRIKVMMPPVAPVRMVAAAHTAPQANKVLRGPKRSPIQPPITWKKK